MSGQKVNILDSVIAVKGRIFWNDGRRRIDLKKPIRDVFEPLETESQKILYTMEMCLSRVMLLKRAEELTSQQVLPILLYFVKDSDSHTSKRMER